MSSGPNYTPVNWALTGVASGLTVGRYAIRYWNSRRFYWDDLAHLSALLMLIIHGVTNEWSLDSKAQIANAATAQPQPSQAELLGLYQHNQTLSTVNNCFLYLVFWLVKLSFLSFYYQLFQTSATFKKVWWGVFAITLLTFWIPIGGVLATCAGADSVAAYKICGGQTYARLAKLEYSCAFNVATDLAIMALPLWMLRGLKINAPQKIALGFIFSLAAFCVILDIVRVIEAVAQNQALYTIIEINFVVIISCLPTYRALVGMSKRKESRRPSGSYPWRSADGLFSKGSGSGTGSKNSALRSVDDTEAQMEDKAIHVTQELEVRNGVRDPYPLDPPELGSMPSTDSPRFQTRAFT